MHTPAGHQTLFLGNGHGELLPPLAATAPEHLATLWGAHALTETVRPFPASSVRLIGPLHFVLRSSENDPFWVRSISRGEERQAEHMALGDSPCGQGELALEDDAVNEARWQARIRYVRSTARAEQRWVAFRRPRAWTERPDRRNR